MHIELIYIKHLENNLAQDKQEVLIKKEIRLGRELTKYTKD